MNSLAAFTVHFFLRKKKKEKRKKQEKKDKLLGWPCQYFLTEPQQPTSWLLANNQVNRSAVRGWARGIAISEVKLTILPSHRNNPKRGRMEQDILVKHLVKLLTTIETLKGHLTVTESYRISKWIERYFQKPDSWLQQRNSMALPALLPGKSKGRVPQLATLTWLWVWMLCLTEKSRHNKRDI